MKKLVLALSGGGFRASLYHLRLLRFLVRRQPNGTRRC
jgi:hypothetical protein